MGDSSWVGNAPVEPGVFTPKFFADLAQASRNARLALVENSGHFFPMEKPAESAKIIVSFLDRVKPNRKSKL